VAEAGGKGSKLPIRTVLFFRIKEGESFMSTEHERVLGVHFGKAAAFHEEKAACHKAAADEEKKMVAIHKVAHDHFDSGDGKGSPDAKVQKAFHKAGMAHHAFKAGHHEKMHKAESAMCDAYKAGAFDLGSDGKKADAVADLTKNAKDDLVVKAFWNQYWPAVNDLDA
jgi:hypothetical protein